MEIGEQYDPALTASLRKMDSRHLISLSIQLDPFVRLEELNLSHNDLTDIVNINLQSLKRLKVLDVSSNFITNSIREVHIIVENRSNSSQIAAFLDGMKKLECVAIRDNPIMKGEVDRKKLLGSMESMRSVECTLKVLDTWISIDERIDAWKSEGGDHAQAEMIRYKAVMNANKTPDDQSDPKKMTTLDLKNSGFEKIDLKQYESLTTLLIQGNKLRDFESSGISGIKTLTLLDVRDNSLERMEDVVELVRALPKLESISISGNRFSDGSQKNWRQKFLSLYSELSYKRCSLKILDEESITLEEIVAAWKVHISNLENSKTLF